MVSKSRVWGVLAALLMLIAGAGPVTAVPPFMQQEQPAAPSLVKKPSPPRVSYIGSPKETYQIFVFGDSLAAGLFSGMSRIGEGDLRLSIDGRFKDESGLARPEFYDWAAALPKVYERREIDVAVILLGSNDGQDIRTTTGPIVFATPDWASSYAQRVDEIIRLLKARGIAIYWVELPPMGPAPLEAEANYVATIQRDRALRERIRYVEIRKVFTDVNGRYTDRGADISGTVTRLRSRDGIHFLKSGNNKLGMLVLDAIRRDIAIADGRVTRVFVSPHKDFPESAPEEKEAMPVLLPMFGQMAGAKEEVQFTVVTADPKWASAVLAVGRAGAKGDQVTTSQTILTALKSRVSRESNAGRLLFEGRWPEPRKGRYDDFTWSKQD